mmetsp:Transcript_131591/g.232563  ORF Transcript_131591/g.232563 Transcript_131591/m.232563 type:complete len:355 (+) Transcript_131591:45-1109(+)
MGAEAGKMGAGADKIREVTFNHLDPPPSGKYNPYSREQSAAIANAVLNAPLGGKLKVPGLEDRFEIVWGSEAKGWRPASSGMYQRNITNGNKRAVEVTEIDAWLEVYEHALSQAPKTPCRYWDKCYNHNPDHRRRFLHPEGSDVAVCPKVGGSRSDAAVYPKVGGPRVEGFKVQLYASVLGGISLATAYHTSVLVNGEEFSFSPDGISRCRGPLSHQNADRPPQIVDMGVSTESGDRLFAALKNHFRPGTYDLLFKNCNSFSDLALYFLVQQRLSMKYRVLERCGMSLPGLVEKVSGGGYVPNDRATNFDKEAVVLELDKILASPPAVCRTPGCGKPTWNGMPGERCSKACGIR